MRRTLHPLFVMLMSLTQQELARQIAYLKKENEILRARLPERICTTKAERKKLLKSGRKFGPKLRELISIVKYESFLRWVREKEQGSFRKPAGLQIFMHRHMMLCRVGEKFRLCGAIYHHES